MQAVRMDKSISNSDWITDEDTKIDLNKYLTYRATIF